MKYECEKCNYRTDDKSHINRHYKTAKHIAKCMEDSKIARDFSPQKRLVCTSTQLVHTSTQKLCTEKRLPQPLSQGCKISKPISQGNEDFYDEIDEKSDNLFICSTCSERFKHKTQFYRHKKKCIESFISNGSSLQIKNIELKTQLELKERELKMKDLICELEKYKSENNVYRTENEYHKNLTTNAGNVAGKTVSALTYILTNFNNAPKIQQLDDQSAKHLLTFETKDGKITGPIVGKTPLQYLLDLYESGKLVQHLGNIVISQYKKQKPIDQSMWNTDPSRLSYVIRNTTSIVTNSGVCDKTIWENDKGGIKINDYIIKPLLSQLKILIIEYDNAISKSFDTLNEKQRDKYADNSRYTIPIKETINSGSLNRELLRYITPYFYFMKYSTL
jgi:hypothetical protein